MSAFDIIIWSITGLIWGWVGGRMWFRWRHPDAHRRRIFRSVARSTLRSKTSMRCPLCGRQMLPCMELLCFYCWHCPIDTLRRWERHGRKPAKAASETTA